MSNINLFYGDEDFLIDEEVKKIKSGFSELNIERIDGSRCDIGRVISALSTMPMLGGEHLIIIENLEDDGEEELFLALQNLDKGTKVIFIFYDGVDKRKKFYKFIERSGEAREFKGLSEWEQDKALAWIVGRVRHYGKKISGQAANILIEIVGLNLRMLDKEIEKIVTYIGGRDIIEAADVENLASSGEIDAYAFSNAVRDKDLIGAMDSLNKLFKDNEDPHMLLSLLARLYRMLLQVKCLEMEGMSQYEIASRLRAKPFFIKKCMERTGAFTQEELAGKIKMLHFADLKMKSGSPPRLTMEMLVPELCNGKHPGK